MTMGLSFINGVAVVTVNTTWPPVKSRMTARATAREDLTFVPFTISSRRTSWFQAPISSRSRRQTPALVAAAISSFDYAAASSNRSGESRAHTWED
jgi:hypothetical protein